MLLYSMVLCFKMWGGLCGSYHASAPVSQPRCYADLAQVRNLKPDDRAWCKPVWIKPAR